MCSNHSQCVYVRSLSCLECGIEDDFEKKNEDESLRALVSTLHVVHDGAARISTQGCGAIRFGLHIYEV